jgi:hypothetical protein
MSDTDKVNPKSAPEQKALALRVWESFVRARDSGHIDFATQADINSRFVFNEQWSAADKDKLDEQGRPALTINLILPLVTTVMGEQRRSRASFVAKPTNHDTDAEQSENMTKIMAFAQEKCDYDSIESQVFDDGIIMDRGYYDVRMSFQENVYGDVKIRSLDPRTVVLDPDAKEYDSETWTRVFTTEWMTLDEVAELYGKKKADELKHSTPEEGGGYNGDVAGSDQIKFGVDDYTSDSIDNGSPESKRIRAVRVIERQERQLHMGEMLVDTKTGSMSPMPDDWDEEKKVAALIDFGLARMKKLSHRWRWTVIANQTILHDGWSPYEFCTVVPYFPYFLRGMTMGLVTPLISPQEQLNKTESQELHILNTTANSGYMVEDGSLINMDMEDLEERGAETGLVMVYRRGSEKPEKITPNQPPSGLDRKSQKSAQYLREISGVSDEMQGFGSPEVSGVAIKAKQDSGAVKFDTPFNNLKRSRKLVGQRVMKLIGKYYQNERMIRITDYKNPAEPNEQNMTMNKYDPVTGMVENAIVPGEYDLQVDSTPSRDSLGDTQFAEMLSMKQVGIHMPDDAIVERSNLIGKLDLAERIRKEQGTAAPTPEQQEEAQFIQEAKRQQITYELNKLESEITLNNSIAELNMAKKEVELNELEQNGDEEGAANMKIEMAKMQHAQLMQDTKLKEQRVDLQLSLANKVEIAEMQVGVKRETMLHGSAMNRGNTALAIEAERTKRKQMNSTST